MNSEGKSLTKSPLCNTDSMQMLLRMAELYDKKDNGHHYKSWEAQLNSLEKGREGGSSLIGYIHAIHLFKFAFESLDKALTVDTPDGSISLKDRVEEMRINQEQNWKQILNGEAPEFNHLIGTIVDQKLKDIGVNNQQRTELPENRKKMQSVLKILKEMNRSQNDDRTGTIFQGMKKIQKILATFETQTEAEEAVEQLVLLVNSMNPQNCMTIENRMNPPPIRPKKEKFFTEI